MDSTMNVFISTFAGLSLPSCLCLHLPSSSNIHDILELLTGLLPHSVVQNSILTTTGNKIITPSTHVSLHELARSSSADNESTFQFLNLRLSAPLVGGKGGFGSQLRAAGGRMSAKKRRQNAELATGSARNLDGRRLRTITEAKNLATYLATKPEMDRKEKEERRKRWEQVIELSEQREADMRAGKTADGRRKGLSEEWIQEKEDVGDNVRNAVRFAMAAEGDETQTKHKTSGSDQSQPESTDEDSDEEDPMELSETDMTRLRKEAEAGDSDAIWVLRNKLKIPSSYLPRARSQSQKFAGFDDELSSEEEEEEDEEDEEDAEPASKGKAAVRG